MDNKYYIIIIEGGCYVSQSDPYDTYEDRDNAAKVAAREENAEKGGLAPNFFWADVENGELKVGEFTSEFEEFEDEDE